MSVGLSVRKTVRKACFPSGRHHPITGRLRSRGPRLEASLPAAGHAGM
jgi:hypothetical protein